VSTGRKALADRHRVNDDMEPARAAQASAAKEAAGRHSHDSLVRSPLASALFLAGLTTSFLLRVAQVLAAAATAVVVASAQLTGMPTA
jgi:hypothetical protein